MRPQLEFSCPEKWNSMSPKNGGRYCGSCEKVVTDFSRMSNEEIVSTMNSSNAGACGSFKAHQLEQPFNDKRNVLIGFYQRLTTSKTIFPRFISLGLVTALLFLSGCHRRTVGRYASASDLKKSGKQHEKQQKDARAAYQKKVKNRKVQNSW